MNADISSRDSALDTAVKRAEFGPRIVVESVTS
jgi:hypothetical protein